MEEKTPVEKLFDQMSGLLKLVEEGMKRGIDEDKAPPDIEMRLKQLEKDVDAFVKQGDKVVELSGLSSVEMRKYRDGMVEDLVPEAKELLDKAQKLQMQAVELEENYKMGTLPMEKEEKRSVDDSEFRKQRRKKFKRLGGDSKWKPL